MGQQFDGLSQRPQDTRRTQVRPIVLAAASLALLATAPAFADDVTGADHLLCTTVRATECYADGGCLPGNPEDWGSPRFVTVDFKEKMLRTTEASGEDRQRRSRASSAKATGSLSRVSRTAAPSVLSSTRTRGPDRPPLSWRATFWLSFPTAHRSSPTIEGKNHETNPHPFRCPDTRRCLPGYSPICSQRADWTKDPGRYDERLRLSRGGPGSRPAEH